jgi:hypothetical protein
LVDFGGDRVGGDGFFVFLESGRPFDAPSRPLRMVRGTLGSWGRDRNVAVSAAVGCTKSGRILATVLRGSTGSGEAIRESFVVPTRGPMCATLALVLVIAAASLCGAIRRYGVLEQSRIQRSQVHLHPIQRGPLVLALVCPLYIDFDVRVVSLAVPAEIDPRERPEIVHRNRRHLLHHVLHRRGGALRKERPASPQHGLLFRSETRAATTRKR